MKRMAVMNGNTVINTIVASDDEPETNKLIAYTENNPAQIGGEYLSGLFYPEQPYPSWSRREGKWIPPIAMPSDGPYLWNEDRGIWEKLA